MSPSEKDLFGKKVVVTGGTNGIGRATAQILSRRGADVIVIGRDPIRGAEVEAELKRNSGGVGVFIQADLSLVSETRRVAASVSKIADRLEAVIQSAGIFDSKPSRTSEGLDKVFVTNFLHKLVFSEGVADLLEKGKGRVVLVAANIPDWVTPGWSNFEGRRIYSGPTSLARMHAASLAMIQRLARDWELRGIEITAINPGQIDTGIYRSYAGFPWNLLRSISRPLFSPVNQPAELISWLAFSPEAKGLSGRLFSSPRNRRKHRKLRRSEHSLERIFKTAREVISSVGH